MEVVPVKMTSLDIRKQEFKRVYRGLDPDEITAFPDSVADSFEALNRERLQALEREAGFPEQVERYAQMETASTETTAPKKRTRRVATARLRMKKTRIRRTDFRRGPGLGAVARRGFPA